ncbi:MAG: hypothetical protein BRD37_06555 [Bacteroidetes bacterium QH_8_67_23]|nr:MAG: hypothetical protein BRD37_06555 [Bacteroidetes bacterium QH_8_67_23]
MRDHIKHTYDLCLYKRKKIADGWVTATNLLISLSGSRDVKDYASGGDGRKTIDDALGLKVRRPRSVAPQGYDLRPSAVGQQTQFRWPTSSSCW